MSSRYRLQCLKILTVFLLALSMNACSLVALQLFVVNGLASSGEYSTAEDVRYGEEAMQSLDIYHRSTNPEPNTATVVIFYYGGCWGACTALKKTDYRFVAESLVNDDTLLVIPDYRRYPKVLFTDLIDDARLTVEWVRANIAEYGGDPDRVFLMGHSSGAHMAALLALDERYLTIDSYQSIKGFIGLAGPYDFLPFTKDYQPVLFGPPDNYAKSQPVNFISGGEPPLMLLYGNKDQTVKARNINSLSSTARESGLAVETHFYQDLNHSGLLAALSIPLRGGSTVREDIQGFIQRHRQ